MTAGPTSVILAAIIPVLVAAAPADARARWWMDEPVRLVQTNLRETDSSLDAKRLVQQVAEFPANTLLFNMGGIVAQYPTRVAFHYASPHLPPGRDLFGEVLREAHARGLRVIGRFDLSKTQRAVFDARPEWFFRRSSGEPAVYNGLYSACINGGYYREHAPRILAEALERYAVDGLFFNMFYLAEHTDVIMHESNTSVTRPLPLWPYSASDNVNRARNSEPDKMAINLCMSFVDFPWRFVAVPRPEVQRRLHQSLAHGGPPALAMLGTMDQEDRSALLAARPVFQWHARHEDLYVRQRSAAPFVRAGGRLLIAGAVEPAFPVRPVIAKRPHTQGSWRINDHASFPSLEDTNLLFLDGEYLELLPLERPLLTLVPPAMFGPPEKVWVDKVETAIPGLAFAELGAWRRPGSAHAENAPVGFPVAHGAL